MLIDTEGSDTKPRGRKPRGLAQIPLKVSLVKKALIKPCSTSKTRFQKPRGIPVEIYNICHGKGQREV